MDRSDIETIARSYLRQLAERHDLRLEHSKLKTDAAMVALINRTVAYEKDLSTNDLPAWRTYLYDPDEETRSFQDTIKAMPLEQSCALGSGANPTAAQDHGNN